MSDRLVTVDIEQRIAWVTFNRQHLEERLARYKVPKFVTFIDSMPRNAAGKLHKAALRRRARAEARARAQGAKE